MAPVPFVGEALTNPGELEGVGPDLVDCEFGPVGDFYILWGLAVELHDLLPLKELLHEMQGTVIFSW